MSFSSVNSKFGGKYPMSEPQRESSLPLVQVQQYPTQEPIPIRVESGIIINGSFVPIKPGSDNIQHPGSSLSPSILPQPELQNTRNDNSGVDKIWTSQAPPPISSGIMYHGYTDSLLPVVIHQPNDNLVHSGSTAQVFSSSRGILPGSYHIVQHQVPKKRWYCENGKSCCCCKHKTALYSMAIIDTTLGLIFFTLFLFVHIQYTSMMPEDTSMIPEDKKPDNVIFIPGIVFSVLITLLSIILLFAILKESMTICSLSYLIVWILFMGSIIGYYIITETKKHWIIPTWASILLFIGLILYKFYEGIIIRRFINERYEKNEINSIDDDQLHVNNTNKIYGSQIYPPGIGSTIGINQIPVVYTTQPFPNSIIGYPSQPYYNSNGINNRFDQPYPNSTIVGYSHQPYYNSIGGFNRFDQQPYYGGDVGYYGGYTQPYYGGFGQNYNGFGQNNSGFGQQGYGGDFGEYGGYGGSFNNDLGYGYYHRNRNGYWK